MKGTYFVIATGLTLLALLVGHQVSDGAMTEGLMDAAEALTRMDLDGSGAIADRKKTIDPRLVIKDGGTVCQGNCAGEGSPTAKDLIKNSVKVVSPGNG